MLFANVKSDQPGSNFLIAFLVVRIAATGVRTPGPTAVNHQNNRFVPIETRDSLLKRKTYTGGGGCCVPAYGPMSSTIPEPWYFLPGRTSIGGDAGTHILHTCGEVLYKIKTLNANKRGRQFTWTLCWIAQSRGWRRLDSTQMHACLQLRLNPKGVLCRCR